jgi:hypothetical protein
MYSKHMQLVDSLGKSTRTPCRFGVPSPRIEPSAAADILDEARTASSETSSMRRRPGNSGDGAERA